MERRWEEEEGGGLERNGWELREKKRQISGYGSRVSILWAGINNLRPKIVQPEMSQQLFPSLQLYISTLVNFLVYGTRGSASDLSAAQHLWRPMAGILIG